MCQPAIGNRQVPSDHVDATRTSSSPATSAESHPQLSSLPQRRERTYSSSSEASHPSQRPRLSAPPSNPSEHAESALSAQERIGRERAAQLTENLRPIRDRETARERLLELTPFPHEISEAQALMDGLDELTELPTKDSRSVDNETYRQLAGALHELLHQGVTTRDEIPRPANANVAQGGDLQTQLAAAPDFMLIFAHWRVSPPNNIRANDRSLTNAFLDYLNRQGLRWSDLVPQETLFFGAARPPGLEQVIDDGIRDHGLAIGTRAALNRIFGFNPERAVDRLNPQGAPHEGWILGTRPPSPRG